MELAVEPDRFGELSEKRWLLKPAPRHYEITFSQKRGGNA
jgi:hypothetical protein